MSQKNTTIRIMVIAWSALGLALATQFNACSKVGFGTSALSSNLRGESTGSIQINNGAKYTKSSAVTLSLSSFGASEMFISNDSSCSSGSWEPYKTRRSWTLANLNQDSSVYAKFRGPDFPAEDCVSASIIHDDIAPAVAVDAPVPSLTNNSSVGSTFHATDAGSGVDQLLCILPGQVSATPCNGKYNDVISADGGYSIQFLASDLAGNVSTPVVQSFTVDMTPPVLALNSTPLALSGVTTAKFEFSATDNLSGVKQYECQLDSAAYAVCTTGIVYSNLSLGNHAFHARAVDNAGNISQVANFSWAVDTTAPTVQFTQTPPPVSNSNSATFGFNGKESDGTAITQFECRVDNGAFAACTSPSVVNNLAEGMHSFGVRGQSRYGIYSSELVYNWSVDLTAPVIAITQTPPALTNSNSAQFVFTVTDSGSGVAAVGCSLDNGAYQDCKTLTANFSNLAGDAQHTFRVQAFDGAGNKGDSVPYVWEIDNTPPTIKIDSYPQALTALANATFTVSGTDLHGPLTYQCRLDSAPVFTSCANPIKYTSLSDGTHTFYVQSKDVAGNLSPIANYSWTVVTTGPTITFTQTPKSTILNTEASMLSYTLSDDFTSVASASCKLDNVVLTCPVPNGTLNFPAQAVGAHTFTITATNALGISSTRGYTFNSREVVCTTTISSTTIPTKMLFIVDMSGSNQSANNCTVGPNCTDPGKKMRAGSIQAFYDMFGMKSNFSWSFDIFKGTTSTALINNGSPSSPVFGNAAVMQTAINSFKGMVDSDNTPYMAALNLATTAISNDPDLRKTTDAPQYIVVFMSDGVPNGSGDTSTNILNQVRTIVGLSPGRVSFNAVYYGPANATASGLIQSMASAGNGNFLNTNTNPTGLSFQISDLISVPVTTCE